LKLEGSISDAISWLDVSQEASKDEYELRQKELEGIANPYRS
jgi:L1 cell adhesion molecule like protein